MAFAHLESKVQAASDDLASLVSMPLKRTKSAPLKDEVTSTEHDSFFNNTRRAEYETHLSQIFMTHLAPFMVAMNKVSLTILPDILKVFIEAGTDPSSISTKMHEFFMNDFDLNILFKTPRENIGKFYLEVTNALQSTDPKDFYKQMCIQRSYITFFTEKGKAKPELLTACEEKWTAHVDLEKLLADIISMRKDGLYFHKNHRIERHRLHKKTSENIGIMPPEAYRHLSSEDEAKLADKLPTHKPGMLQFFMTTVGGFAKSGMLDYDFPQICGPSGMTAMRLALANQAGLDLDEKKLIDFAISLYHVAIGAHTVDECYMIGNDTDFNSYIRGDYRSIVPRIIKEGVAFRDMWTRMQALNERYRDILVSVSSAGEEKETKEAKGDHSSASSAAAGSLIIPATTFTSIALGSVTGLGSAPTPVPAKR